MTTPVLKIHPTDDLAVALEPLEAGRALEVGGVRITVRKPVSQKHQVALRDIAAGESITYYGVTVGVAREAIPSGTSLTTGNVSHATGGYRVGETNGAWEAPDVSAWKGRTFRGYARPDGRVGTANTWIVVPLVFCENRNVGMLRQAFEEELGYAAGDRWRARVRRMVELHRAGKPLDDAEVGAGPARARLFPNVDGIRFLSHHMGCGGTDEDTEVLCRLLAAYIAHPNTAGATVLSLGCQKAQIRRFEQALGRLGKSAEKPLVVLEQQREGTEERLLGEAVRRTFEGLVRVNGQERAPAGLDKLTLGVECGGSDGFSGISANPTVGRASDLLVALGGSVILSEFPELCGQEQNLINRCRTPEVAERFVALMKAYEDRAKAVGADFTHNPSAGNIAAGLVTDAIKSAGAARKGGTSPVVDALDYPGRATVPGLTLLCTPGSDVESTTGLAAAGANLIAFTTGLGTPTGNPVTPVVKISTTSELARRMPDIIDYDAGPVLDGTPLDQAGAELLDLLIRVAGGETRTKADLLGQADFLPWKRGISL